MKLNYNYVRQALINVSCNTGTNFTIKSLADTLVDKSDISEYSSAVYSIFTIIGDLLYSKTDKKYSYIDKNIEIIGVTKKGMVMLQYIKDDNIWNVVQKRSEGIGGVSFQVMVDCCASLSK